ncbi:hypothetical protein TRFO_41698 [Tritrichomonas foetus]|uniref:Uncharacterized protein n=1 Tax=Tritrichomonas foetus TaxID=1144522 RepID=A0A1J4KZC7_9EUKA|nr:hypothetical protein TRFO_41698 [Tritrichomonas foetus]|eukprot:OHT16603.1 hypothetical protein TRFO_41698 [Tritrichomonas foetus]
MQLTDHELNQSLSEIQDLYENTLSDQRLLDQFNTKWIDFKNRASSIYQTKILNSQKFELRSITQTIQTVFQKLSAKSVIAGDNYSLTVKNFREDLQSVKQLLVVKHFTNQYIEITKSFYENFTNEYKKIFLTAKINPETREKLVKSLETSISNFLNIIDTINSDKSLPPALAELCKLIGPYDNNKIEEEKEENENDGELGDVEEEEDFQNEEEEEEEDKNNFNFHSNSENQQPSFNIKETNSNDENEDGNEGDDDGSSDDDVSSEPADDSDFGTNEFDFSSERLRKEKAHSFLEDYLSQLLCVSSNLYSIANKVNNTNNSKEIKVEAEKINTLAQRDLFHEFNHETKKLDHEIRRSREMIALLNKAQSMRTNMSNKVLEKLSKEDLIVLLHGFVANNEEIKIPIELTVAKGSPAEFKELAEKYRNAAKYNEEANAEIQRMNVAMIQLRSENQRMKCQMAAISNEASLHNELDEINSQIFKIENQLEKDEDSEEHDDLEYELNELKAKKENAEFQLSNCDKYDLHMQIEMLKGEATEYQRIIEQKQKENEDLQKEMKILTQRIAKKDAQENKIAQQQLQFNQQHRSNHNFSQVPNQMQQQQQQQQNQQPNNVSNVQQEKKTNKRRNTLAETLPHEKKASMPHARLWPVKRELKSAYAQQNFRRKSWSEHKEVIRVNRPPFRP